MATTTNYGWQTPDDTALVKDGASAIRSLGSSIDTTTKALNPETTLGDISYRSSTANTNTRLAIGTSGQVLSVNGSGVPAWTTISSGGMTLISEQTLSAVTSVTYNSLGSYKQLLLVWGGIYHSASGSEFVLRLNNSTSANYKYGFINSNDSSLTSGSTSNSIVISQMFGSSASSTTAQETSKGYFVITNYTSSTKQKNYYGGHSYANNFGNNITYNYSGFFADTTAITSLDIVRLSGSATLSNLSNTTISLYGVS
jgi:hypothetical protein